MKTPNTIVVVIHTFKGRDGQYLSYEYLRQLLILTKKRIIYFKVYIHFYGFLDEDNEELIQLFNSLKDVKRLSLEYEFKPSVRSEVPTLKFTIDLSKNLDPDCFVIYFHSKGASYEDQSYQKNWSLLSIAGLAAAIDVLHGRKDFINLYDAFGSFAAIGVLERYGQMTPHFSGNFWITTAKFLATKEIKNKWYVYSYHNRHFAEGLLGKESSPELLFNLMSNYQINSLSRPDLDEVYRHISNELSEMLNVSIRELEEVNGEIRNYYKTLQEQHTKYNSGRYFWSIRKYILGNNSYVRYYKIMSKILDKVFPYTNSHLYRHYSGPKHFDIYSIKKLKK